MMLTHAMEEDLLSIGKAEVILEVEEGETTLRDEETLKTETETEPTLRTETNHPQKEGIDLNVGTDLRAQKGLKAGIDLREEKDLETGIGLRAGIIDQTLGEDQISTEEDQTSLISEGSWRRTRYVPLLLL